MLAEIVPIIGIVMQIIATFLRASRICTNVIGDLGIPVHSGEEKNANAIAASMYTPARVTKEDQNINLNFCGCSSLKVLPLEMSFLIVPFIFFIFSILDS